MNRSLDISKRQTSQAPDLVGARRTGVGERQVSGRTADLLKVGVSVLLVFGLGFVVLTNYLGWTARVEVASVKVVCQGDVCQQRLRVRGSQRGFFVKPEPVIKPGDFVDVAGTCTPGCKLEVVAVWSRAKGERVSLASLGGER